MQATSLSEVFSHPSFLTILATILIVIANIMIGVSMLPKDKRKKRYKIHRVVYGATLISLGVFLAVTHRLLGNSIFNYFVMAYFLIIIPLSRKWNVTAHAIISSVGLVLLVGIAAFSIL
jgi:energy-converting hydrogenase Eha subunit A